MQIDYTINSQINVFGCIHSRTFYQQLRPNPRTRSSFVLCLRAQPGRAYYLRSGRDWACPIPPGGPRYCDCRSQPLRLSQRDLGARCGAQGAHGASSAREGGEGAGHTNSPLPSVMWALSRNRTAPASSFILSYLGGRGWMEGWREGGPVQSGQRGRDQST